MTNQCLQGHCEGRSRDASRAASVTLTIAASGFDAELRVRNAQHQAKSAAIAPDVRVGNALRIEDAAPGCEQGQEPEPHEKRANVFLT